MTFAALSLLAVGCVSQQTADPAASTDAPLTEKVTLSDLVPAERRDAPRDPGAEQAAQRYARIAAHQLVVQRLVFRREAPRLKLITDTLEPPPFDPDLIARWQANGFGVGQIDLTGLPLLLANTPSSLGSSVARHTGPLDWVPLVTLEKVAGSHEVDYVTPDGHRRTIRQRFGHQQLLLRFEPAPADADAADPDAAGILLALLPQHYRAEISLQPRTPQQKMLDGDVWHDLRIAEPIPTKRAWVIWANLPDPPPAWKPNAPDPPASPSPAPADDATPEAASPDDDADADASLESQPSPESSDHRSIPVPTVDPSSKPEPRRPLTLAESMLTGMRGNDPVQMVIVIYVEPPATAASAPAPGKSHAQGPSR